MPAAPAPVGSRSEEPKPGVQSSLGEGWQVLRANFWTLIVATLVYMGVEAVSNVFTVGPGPGGPQRPISVLSPLFSILVTAPLLVGFAHLVLRAVRGHEPQLNDLLAGFRTYVNAVGGMLLYSIAITVGLILLIVPGIVAMVRLSFTPYLIVDRDLDPVGAVKTSWQLTAGHGWSLFGLLLVSVLILVGGVLLLIVGVVPAMAWVMCGWAVYYNEATGPPARTSLDQGPPDNRPRGG